MLLSTYNIRRTAIIAIIIFISITLKGWMPNRTIPFYSLININPDTTTYYVLFISLLISLIITLVRPTLKMILIFIALLITHLLIDIHKFHQTLQFFILLLFIPKNKSDNNVEQHQNKIYINYLIGILYLSISVNRINPNFNLAFTGIFPDDKLFYYTTFITIIQFAVGLLFLFLTNKKEPHIFNIVLSIISIITCLIFNNNYTYVLLNVILLYLSYISLFYKTNEVPNYKMPLLLKSILVSITLFISVSLIGLINNQFSFNFFSGRYKDILIISSIDGKYYLPNEVNQYLIQLDENTLLTSLTHFMNKNYNMCPFQSVKSLQSAISFINPLAYKKNDIILIFQNEFVRTENDLNIINTQP